MKDPRTRSRRSAMLICNLKCQAYFQVFFKKMFNLFNLFYPIYIRGPLCILEKPEMTFQDAAIIDLRKPEMTFYKWGPLWTPQKPEMLFCFLLAFLGRRYSAHFDAKPHTLSVYLVVIYTLSSLRRFVKYILKKYWFKSGQDLGSKTLESFLSYNLHNCLHT